MAKAKNKVIAGYKEGESVWSGNALAFNGSLMVGNMASICKETVSTYEVITEEMMKSGTSAILRGSIGSTLLGPVGLLAGLSAKNKGIYTIAIEWKSGGKSLLEIDDKLYKLLVKKMF